jgi:purine nucleoside phosphorylase
MSLGPEVVLANELEIPTLALVVGHKYSVPGNRDVLDHHTISESLDRARHATEKLITTFLESARPVPFKNHLHVFESSPTR